MATKQDNIYRDLRKHLDHQAVGFPATKSGAEIRLLKRLFSPEETGLAMHLSYKPRSADEIFEAARGNWQSREIIVQLLDSMRAKGSIGHVIKNGQDHYHLHPFIVGIYEWQLNNLTPEFLADMRELASNRSFGLSFLETKLPQMRTIPIQKSLRVDHNVTTYDHVRELIDNTAGPIGIMPCICRKAAVIGGKKCQKTARLETCMTFGDWARNAVKGGLARQIEKDEALEIVRLNEAEGLVLQPSNDQKIDFL